MRSEFLKREFILSALFHLVAISAILVSSPFEPESQFDYDDIIRVTLPAGDPFAATEPAPVEIPQAMVEEPPEIALDDPTTKPIAEIEEPVEEPKPKPEEKKDIIPDAKPAAVTQDGAAEAEDQSQVVGRTGSPFAGATVDNVSFDYPFWFDLAFDKIGRNFRNTVSYDGTLICVVYFQVIKSGRVIEISVRESSGIPAFDDVCKLSIEKSKPFPPLPREFRDEIIGITIPFKWSPR